jgi:hypothetical protein
MASPILPSFYTLSHKRHNFRKNVIARTICFVVVVVIFSIKLPEIFLIIGIIQRNTIIKVHESSRKVAIILLGY